MFQKVCASIKQTIYTLMKTSLPYSLSIYKYLCFAHFFSFLRSQLSSSVIHLILLNFILCAVGQSINKYIQNIQDVVSLSLMTRHQYYSLNIVYLIIFRMVSICVSAHTNGVINVLAITPGRPCSSQWLINILLSNTKTCLEFLFNICLQATRPLQGGQKIELLYGMA